MNMHTIISVHGYGDAIVADLKGVAPDESLDGPLFLKYAKNLPEPRILKANIPLSLLNPNLLDTCKVSNSKICFTFIDVLFKTTDD